MRAVERRAWWTVNPGSAGFSLPVELAALAVLVAGYALASYALVENACFSGMVRIQTDSGQPEVSTGP